MLTCDLEDINLGTAWHKAVGDRKIVVINGVGGSGKDTFVFTVDDLLKKIINPSLFANDSVSIVKNISTIDCVKHAAMRLGWKYSDKDDRSRKFLSEIKKLSCAYNDMPYQDCRQKIYLGNYKICFVHCREPEEIQRFKDEFKATTLLITRHSVDIPDNSSDRNVFNYEYDMYINNDGSFADLKKEAIKFIKNMGMEEWMVSENND